MPELLTLADWLAHCERLHPKTIEMGLQRTNALRDRLGLRFDVPVITVAGTNGKGSTCAMIESIARQAGYRTGLYIKPHLVHFTERCRVNGEPVAEADLLPHFQAVEDARGDLTLSYFEFTTLAILRALQHAPVDIVILEVGLGGRLDAVNTIDADCAVITSIDIDHVEYLGPDRESIGREKAHVMRAGRPAIVSDPLPPASVVAYAESVGADLWLVGRDFHHDGDRQQWRWAGRGRRYPRAGLPGAARREPDPQRRRRHRRAGIAARPAAHHGAGRAHRAGAGGTARPLPDRARPTDAGAGRGAQPAVGGRTGPESGRDGFYPRTHAVFGAMQDKDLPALLARMQVLVDHWHFCDLATARAAKASDLAALPRPATPGRTVGVSTHASAADGLRAALAAADPADRIVVFGSFYTVGGVLEAGLPKLHSAHASAVLSPSQDPGRGQPQP